MTAVGASSLALGTQQLIPIAVAVALLLVIVVISYRQTIYAYPSGGGSYIVSRENLGEFPSILAAAALLIDYVLTVAVSIAAGVEALISMVPSFVDYRVPICVGLILFMMVLNLRGLKESGTLFAPPVYVYIFMLSALLVTALYEATLGGGLGRVPFDPEIAVSSMKNLEGGSLGLFLILKGFSSGAVALTGVEAISNGVPAFRRPASKNAAGTMTAMGLILGTLFLGTAILGAHVKPYPSHEKTAIAQMGELVWGRGVPFYILQIATFLILTLAANTAYADFPRLAQLIARDGYLPRQFAALGDRLVFSNGIIVLSFFAILLVVIFGGVTTLLIPLYAIGVFTAFTLSQGGMVVHHVRLKQKGWQLSSVINTIGAIATFGVLLIVAITKFTAGAWIPLAVIPPFMLLFIMIKRHYARTAAALVVTPELARPVPTNHTVVVLVGRIHKGVLKALSYAQSLRPQHLIALSVYTDDAEREKLTKQWADFHINIPLEFVHSPYRQLVEPVEAYIDQLDRRWKDDTITVVIPEFVLERWYQNVLHNQTALRLKGTLLFKEGVVVTSVPYHLDSDDAEAYVAEIKSQGLAPGAALSDAAAPHHEEH